MSLCAISIFAVMMTLVQNLFQCGSAGVLVFLLQLEKGPLKRQLIIESHYQVVRR